MLFLYNKNYWRPFQLPRNMSESSRLLKNATIKQHCKDTLQKHASWKLCIVEAKLNEKSFSKVQTEQLQRQFIEAKWLWNDWISKTTEFFKNGKANPNYDKDFDTSGKKWHYRPIIHQKVLVMNKNKQLVEKT